MTIKRTSLLPYIVEQAIFSLKNGSSKIDYCGGVICVRELNCNSPAISIYCQSQEIGYYRN